LTAIGFEALTYLITMKRIQFKKKRQDSDIYLGKPKLSIDPIAVRVSINNLESQIHILPEDKLTALFNNFDGRLKTGDPS
jgi:hypothetical protein